MKHCLQKSISEDKYSLKYFHPWRVFLNFNVTKRLFHWLQFILFYCSLLTNNLYKSFLFLSTNVTKNYVTEYYSRDTVTQSTMVKWGKTEQTFSHICALTEQVYTILHKSVWVYLYCSGFLQIYHVDACNVISIIIV